MDSILTGHRRTTQIEIAHHPWKYSPGALISDAMTAGPEPAQIRERGVFIARDPNPIGQADRGRAGVISCRNSHTAPSLAIPGISDRFIAAREAALAAFAFAQISGPRNVAALKCLENEGPTVFVLTDGCASGLMILPGLRKE